MAELRPQVEVEESEEQRAHSRCSHQPSTLAKQPGAGIHMLSDLQHLALMYSSKAVYTDATPVVPNQRTWIFVPTLRSNVFITLLSKATL